MKLDAEYYELKNLLQQAFSIFLRLARAIGKRTQARHAEQRLRWSWQHHARPSRTSEAAQEADNYA
jgi:hypothetical protein